MQIFAWTVPLSCLLSSTFAFYPYQLPDPETPAVTTSKPGSIQRREPLDKAGLTLGLRRLAHKRDNGFTVISAPTPKQEDGLGVWQDGTDFSYFAAVQFGTSTKTFYLLLDSAASNTWVMSSTCKASACSAHTTLGPSDSSSLQTSSDTFSVAYGTGSVSGTTGTDTLKTPAFSIPFTFGLANIVSDDFNSYPMDGILALGRFNRTTGSTKTPTILDALVSQKVISNKLFGIHLWRAADGGINDGEINFGTPDATRYKGALNYLDAIKGTNGFWEVPVDDAGVDNTKAGLTGRTAIIDSGTSFILMPPDDAAKVHALIPGSAQSGETFTVPCTTSSMVTFTFNGQTYNIPPKDYVGRSTSDGKCMSNIVGRRTFGSTQWLVGDVFMKNVYTVFDYDGTRVGFGTNSAVTTVNNAASTMASGSSTVSMLSSTVSSKAGQISASMVGLIPAAASSTMTGSGTMGTASATASASVGTGSANSRSSSSSSTLQIMIGLMAALIGAV